MARDFIQEEIRLKMLGPGYAKDIICCSEDAKDEIVPGDPKVLYSTGVLMNVNEQEDAADDDNTLEEDAADVTDIQNAVDDNDNNEDVRKYAGTVETPEPESSVNLMNSHIGLVTCVNEAARKVKVSVNYGTYKKLGWDEQRNCVRVKVGNFYKTFEQALLSFAQDKVLNENLKQNNLPDFNEWFDLSEDGLLSISPKIISKPTKTPIIPNKEYPIEASLVYILLGRHYQRTHHSIDTLLQLDVAGGEMDLDDNIQLLWNSFNANGKKFLKVLLRPKAEKTIFQPQITIEVPDGCGCIESYVEPITSLEDDNENNINEFLYRKVKNYGKGVNCALEWSEDGQKIATTFMPTSEIEKFTSASLSIDGAKDMTSACQLRNLSIWSKLDKESILNLLASFVNSYAQWHEKQIINSKIEPDNFRNEIAAIIDRQQELLDRLNDNIEYLRNNDDVFECFKIANTAMLLQMVVARHPKFKKDKEFVEYNTDSTIYNSLDFFEKGEYVQEFDEPKYYPFQLAFLLMNVKSTFVQDDKYRKSIVDLIWFPTGGGKTEAYLALTALTIVSRRRRGQEKGVSVIMRYTLRMLTSQQFERASYLICALEMLRCHKREICGLGEQEISIGLYVGSGVTPNQVAELTQRNSPYYAFFKSENREANPFPVTFCPWCGCKMVSPDGKRHGYDNKHGVLFCINNNCHFNNNLPIYYIDEQIYQRKPTLLFATVDKFATFAGSKNRSALLCSEGVESPDLIIQDELHLLTGALGSIVGFFETIVEQLCTRDGRSPKIIASTATTRNTHSLIKGLYGKNREVVIFPAMGLEYNDNCFSHIVKGAKRRHIGIMPAVNSNIAEIRLAAFLMLVRVKLFKKYVEEQGGDWSNLEEVSRLINNNGELCSLLDNYWTTVFYFNSLKDLGKSRSRVSQEVREVFRGHQNLYTIPREWYMLRSGFDHRVLEFTSRIESREIKSLLTRAEQRICLEKQENDNIIGVKSGCDLIFASNMISVGIDIDRWNLMVMVGQPRSTSEYVQSSSRVARSTFGLVINLLNPLRLREHSLFENYKPFHSTYYKLVEPLSVTPLTYATIKHGVFKNIIDIFRRDIIGDLGIDPDDLSNELVELFRDRFDLDENLIERIKAEIRIVENREQSKSLRDITQDAYINIGQIGY